MSLKAIFFFFSIFLFSINSFSQVFRAGFTLGGVASDIPGMDTRDHDVDYNKLGFTIGGLVNTSLNEKNKLQMEINFIQKGSSQPPDSNNNGSFRLILNYIEVPLIYRHRLQFNVRKKPVTSFELECGASYGRVYSMKFYDYTNTLQAIPPGSINLNDISLLAGLEYSITPNFLFCVRYSNSLIPVIVQDPLPPGYPRLPFIFYTFNHGDNVVIQFSLKFIFGPSGNEIKSNDQ